jgi:L-seryl-tRNA(Ser) seleniumtransferase
VRDPELEERLRALPSVEQLLQAEPLRTAAHDAPRSMALKAARRAIERRRRELVAGVDPPEPRALADDAVAELARLRAPSLRAVVNATGVVVHTNLGRAPLAAEARRAVELAARGYTNLEYDVEAGGRGSRHAHVEELICDLTGAEAALAVNNNAAAVMLALAALAGGREVVISRGQLVEIGGSFRIPEILAASGARLVEVGTTNRTRLNDYERAIGDQSAALMRVHASNFRTVGFTEDVTIGDLSRLARERGLALIDDLGSGALCPELPAGPDLAAGSEVAERVERLVAALADEPPVRDSVAAGADVVCFSGDKLLGGPQAGIVAGTRDGVERLRSHPMARALRIDKLSLAALEATLRLHLDPGRAVAEIPVLRMLTEPEPELERRAARIRDAIAGAAPGRAEVELVRATGRVGGGALPLLELEGPAVSVRPAGGQPAALQALLRAGRPPVVARVHDDALLLDPRTMDEAEGDLAARAVVAALTTPDGR